MGFQRVRPVLASFQKPAASQQTSRFAPQTLVRRERSAEGEGFEEQKAEASGLARHAFVPTLPSLTTGENARLPPVPQKGSLASRIFRQGLTTRPAQSMGRRGPSAEAMRSAAAAGMRAPATVLPYLDRIQSSFGRHPVDHVKAHVGAEAARASRAMSALAFASGDHVVFGGEPDLRTSAHEAAHIVQQQAGVQLAGGIGREGDAYERHADAVAAAVVAGRSAEGLLAPFAGSPAGQNQITIQRYAWTYGGLQDESGTEIETQLIKPGNTGGGSAVSAWPSWWPTGPAETANDFLRENFVQGHLLNEKLGGPGNKRYNLTPLTRSANSQMSHSIENVAKAYLKKGNAIEYLVRAHYNAHPNVADVGGNTLSVIEQANLQAKLDKMAEWISAEITVSEVSKGMWKRLPNKNQPKVIWVKNEGSALKGSFT